MTKRSILLACFFFALPSLAHAWWNDDWKFRKQLTLDTSASGADIKSAVTDVPVLVRLHTGNFGYFMDMLADGKDLRFIANDDKTPLKYHVEKFDPINEMAMIWVKLPQITANASTDKIWMYYGNTAAKGSDDPSGTYDANQALVYHFDELSAGPKDRTANGINPVTSSAQANPVSLIGAGVRFDGKQSIQLPDAPQLRLDPQKSWTFSAWIKMDGAQRDTIILRKQDGARQLQVGINGNNNVFARYTAEPGKSFETSSNAVLNAGVWYHVALVAGNGGLLTLYVNGAQAAETGVTLQELAGPISIGAAADGSAGFVGEMDEVQISNVARSADWIKAAVRGQGSEAALVSFGGDEQNQGASDTSYFRVILNSVTVDGWVVIVILGVMAAISWIVMFAKGLIIRRTRKDNFAFLDQFNKLGADDTDKLNTQESEQEKEFAASPLSMALFGKHDHFQSSSLYHIYHAGVEQVHRRVGKAAGAQAVLTPQAINVVRAALDAALVREIQRLNSQMVLLTIAISGGPFLGLLGTVVGVMITFAAIAATGDVNVNAIAPGIAAALVATVAGLAVAIPALFGYNYLNSRIKELVADMHVFVDEFITRIAEHYA